MLILCQYKKAMAVIVSTFCHKNKLIRKFMLPPHIKNGFSRIQGLIRLYIRQGLDRDNCNYTLAHDTLFIEKLRKKGVSQSIIDEALTDVNQNCDLG